ncbi:MAG: hypothetical protein JOZ10_02735 [Acidobacteria bacterium]|nr:hypothetical protein [Acidobacteriota bacterium]
MLSSMLVYGVLFLAIGLCAVLLVRFVFSRRAKQRAIQVLGWIDSLVSGHGHITGITWNGASSFHLPVRLRSTTFRNACLRVNLLPKEVPLRWLFSKLKSGEETLIFEADLDWAPPFDLELQKYRLFARTRKELSPEAPGWEFEQTTPFILTTRKDWQKEVSSVISNMVGSPEKQFLSIVFRRQSPHFSATLALDSIAPNSPCRTEIFDSLREIATGASAPQI